MSHLSFQAFMPSGGQNKIRCCYYYYYYYYDNDDHSDDKDDDYDYILPGRLLVVVVIIIGTTLHDFQGLHLSAQIFWKAGSPTELRIQGLQSSYPPHLVSRIEFAAKACGTCLLAALCLLDCQPAFLQTG